MLKAVASSGGGSGSGVSSLNSLTGALDIASAGATILVTQSGSNINLESAGSAPSFNLITSGTNTTASMVVDSGASITATGTGSIVATTVTTNANLTGPITSVGNATSIASQTGTGTKFVVDTNPALIGPNIGTATGTGLILTSASATAFEVGANGSTNPALQVDASVASAATGLKITSNAAGSNVTLSCISSATNEAFLLVPKGTGIMVLSAAATSSIRFQYPSNARQTFSDVQTVFAHQLSTAAATVRFSYLAAASITLTAGAEAKEVQWDLSSTRQHASNTAVALQRDFIILSGTHAFATSGGVETDAATFSVDGAPSAGTNATITNSHALYIPTKALAGTVTNGYGITVNAPTNGATINAAINAVGDILATGNIKISTAGNGISIKSGSNARIGTGTLTGGTVTIANTSVTANSRVFLQDTTSGSLVNVGSLSAVTTAGVGFVVTSTNALDTSTFNWIIFESA